MTILVSGKVDIIAKRATKGKEEYYIIIKASIHHKDITILNMYQPNSRVSKYSKQKLTELKENID